MNGTVTALLKGSSDESNRRVQTSWVKRFVFVRSFVRCITSLKFLTSCSRWCRSNVVCCYLHWRFSRLERSGWLRGPHCGGAFEAFADVFEILDAKNPPRGPRSRVSEGVPPCPSHPSAVRKLLAFVLTLPVVRKHLYYAELIERKVTSIGFLSVHRSICAPTR